LSKPIWVKESIKIMYGTNDPRLEYRGNEPSGIGKLEFQTHKDIHGSERTRQKTDKQLRDVLDADRSSSEDSGLGDVMVRLGGISPDMLALLGLKSHRIKLISIGLLLAFVALLSAFGFANIIRLIFDGNFKLALIAGCVWFCLILLVDISIISSSSKGIGGFLIRLLLAATLAFVSAKGLEIIIMAPFVEQGLQARSEHLRDNIDSRYRSKIEHLQSERMSLSQTIAERHRELEVIYTRRNQEQLGNGITGRAGYGPMTKIIERQIKDTENRVSQLNAPDIQRRNEIDTELKELKRKQAEEIGKISTQVSRSFVAQLQAIEEMGKQDPFVHTVSWIIVMFLMVVDLIPVLIKTFLVNLPREYYELENQVMQIGEDDARNVIELRKTTAARQRQQEKESILRDMEIQDKFDNINKMVLSLDNAQEFEVNMLKRLEIWGKRLKKNPDPEYISKKRAENYNHLAYLHSVLSRKTAPALQKEIIKTYTGEDIQWPDFNKPKNQNNKPANQRKTTPHHTAARPSTDTSNTLPRNKQGQVDWERLHNN